LAYLYLTQKNPEVIQQQGDIEPISCWACCHGENLVINSPPFTSGRIDGEENRRKRVERGECFRPPEKTQRDQAKPITSAAKLSNLRTTGNPRPPLWSPRDGMATHI
jgi:hypothetical protein